jgi:uncharacterized Zn finger protein
MEEQVEIQCPYCGEWVAIAVSPDTWGELVQDCEVCCRPWQLEVTRDDDDVLQVAVTRAQ